MRRSSFIVLAALLAAPVSAAGQHRAGVAFAFSDPQGEFDTNTDMGYGLAGWYRWGLGAGGMVALGVDVTFQQYGSTRRRAPLSTTIPEITVDIETSNQITYVQGAFEIQPATGRIRPYGVLAGGGGFFWTTSSLQDPETHETILSDTNQSDWTWVYSAGGGLRIQLTEMEREDREPGRLFLDLGASWLAGGDVEYLREGSLVTDEGEFDIDTRLTHSEVELILYRIGVTFEF